MRGRLLPVAVTASCVLGLASLSSPAVGQDSSSAGSLDPVIGLLPALPVDTTTYQGDTCADGDRSCIDVTIREMERRLDRDASSCHHDAVFGLAYLRVTEEVRHQLDAGLFNDPAWLSTVDAVFARLYFASMDAWDSGARASVPTAWRIALRAADERAVTGLGNFLLSMNAHINRDFPHVLAEVGLVDADGNTHKPDHDAFNARLDALMGPVFAEEARRFDPTFDDIDIANLDDTAAGVIMRGWREVVWRNAEALTLAKTPLQRALVEAAIEAYAATQARLIRSGFASSSPAARDAWCAAHGTDE